MRLLRSDYGVKDTEGFYILKRKVAGNDNKKPSKDHKIKTRKYPKIKFKKGGWKQALWKKLKDWKSSIYISDFHNRRLATYVIYNNDDMGKSLLDVRGAVKFADMKMLKVVDKDAQVMIACGEGMYSQISLKSYRKLRKVHRIAVHVTLEAYNDYEPDIPMTISDYEEVFDNINGLMSFINYHRQGIIGIYESQAMTLGMTSFIWKVEVLVYTIDGQVNTYKGDMNEFMFDYGLNPF